MKVSVATTTYNHERFIRQAIESVLMQQVNFDYELVIGEDCSTDNTRDIVIDYQKRHPDKIRLLLPERNLGGKKNGIQVYKACQGEYIALLDGDDYWTSPHKLQKQVDFLDSHPECAICFHNAIMFYEDGSQEPRNLSLTDWKEISTLEDLLAGNFIPTCSTMFRRGLFGELPDWYYAMPTGDWPLHILNAQHGKIGYINEVMGAWRIHPGGVYSIKSQIAKLQQKIQACEVLNAALNFRYDRAIKATVSKHYYELAVERYLAGSEELATECLETATEHFQAVGGLWQKRVLGAAWEIEARVGYDAAVGFIALTCDAVKTQPGAANWTRELWGEWYAAHAFQAHQAGDRAAVRRAAWQAVRQDRRLLGNRGLVSIYLRSFVGWKVRKLLLRLSIRHIYGPKKVAYGADQLIALCLVRNGELYMKSFIEHHFSLGVKHIVFLDNDSTDETVSIAQNYENVTVLQTELPYRKYKYLMKQYLIARFAKGRWCLYVDIDELFDYPFSDVVSLGSLIKYLNKKSYTAVVAQMLDMFSDKPLSDRKSRKDDSLKDLYCFYDISNITKEDYQIAQNITSNSEIKIHRGGIRKTLFGVDGLYLTKHPMMFLDDEIKPFVDSSHSVFNAHIADFTCVLFHYKFLGNLYEQAVEAIREGSYYNDSAEYKEYYKVLKQNPNLRIKQETSNELKSVNDLISNGFLVVSEDYMNWVEAMPDGS